MLKKETLAGLGGRAKKVRSWGWNFDSFLSPLGTPLSISRARKREVLEEKEEREEEVVFLKFKKNLLLLLSLLDLLALLALPALPLQRTSPRSRSTDSIRRRAHSLFPARRQLLWVGPLHVECIYGKRCLVSERGGDHRDRQFRSLLRCDCQSRARQPNRRLGVHNQ